MFVPVIPSQPASLEAQEIAREIEEVIVRYQDEHPTTRQADIQQGLQLAMSRAGRGTRAPIAVVAAALGVAVLVGVLALGKPGGGEIPWIAIAFLVFLIIAIVPLIFLLKRR